ncbi:MAG: helix-turn-helix domain-containing protein [Streptococcaceae bacterium]|jgi:hypothetical protein|nr:helix-turn-helix domain-containing protein [Streptococcaceae bacterium]
MKAEAFLALFPKAILNPSSQNYLCFEVEGKQFGLLESDLTVREQQLLLMLFPLKKPQVAHQWLTNLLDKDYQNAFKLRIIQFVVSNKVVEEDFLSSLKLLVPNVEAVFFIDQTQGLLIERFCGEHLSFEEFEEIFQALGVDFSVSITAYLGLFFEKDSYQSIFYQCEREYFKLLCDFKRSYQVTLSFADYFLKHIEQAINQPLANYLKECLQQDSDLKQLIITLWESDTSLSVASSKLFIHRNTLQYKLKKFQEAFGFPLKNLKTLSLCYLLLVQEE